MANTAKQKIKTVKPVERKPPAFDRARAIAKYLRISPRKLRLVIDVVRYQPVEKAFRSLMTLKQKGARITEKILKSAVANAKVIGLEENRLFIADIRADGGPMMKRFMSRSQGRADKILKRMAHLSITLKESDRSQKGPAAQTETEKQEGTSKTAIKQKSSLKKAAAAAKA